MPDFIAVEPLSFYIASVKEPLPLQQVDRTYILYKGRKLIYFAGCDYLRMASHPDVVRALGRTARQAGLNVAASRLTTGNHVLYQQLERALQEFFAAPGATLVQTGYLTNFVAAQALAGQFSHALVDSAAHSALRDSATFLNCPILTFPTRDPSGLAAAVKRCGRGSRPIVLTDGMFARDGSVAPLKEYLRILTSDSMLLVDDSHGAGVVGAKGGGAVEHCGVRRARIIQTVTLSKAFGVYGGAILSSREMRQNILQKSTIFMGSTPLPLPLAGASLESVRIVAKHPELRTRMHRNAERVRGRLRACGFDIPQTPGPVFGLMPRSASVSMAVSAALSRAGIFPSLLRYTGVPRGGIFRFVISSQHTPAQLDLLSGTLEKFSPSDLSRP